MGIVFISLIKSKTIPQILLTILIGLVGYLLYLSTEDVQINGSNLTIFISLFIGVSILQGVKIITDKRYSTFEKSISSIFNNLSEPIFIVNEKTLEISYCNSYAKDILKCSDANQVHQIPFSSLIAPDSINIFNGIVGRMRSGVNKDWNGELELLSLTGEKIWVLFKINLVRFPNDEKFIIKITDISQTKFYEEKLKESLIESEKQNSELQSTKKAIINVMEDLQLERDKAFSFADDLEKFKLAVENASDHIIITDPEGITLYANAAVSKITGYPIQDIIGTKAGKLWSLPMEKEFYVNFWDVIKNKKKIFEGEIQNKRKNGEKYFAQASISPILNEKGEVEFFVGIERDVTKAKEIDKIRSEFVSVASHQLRTPLTSIKWYLELLHGEDSNLTDSQKDIFREIEGSNSRMISLVNDLLNVSRIENGEKYKIEKTWEDIIKLLKTIVADQQLIAQNKKITIRLDSGGFEEFMMSIDKAKLYQSISNLINNAIKYSYENSTIELIFKQESNQEVYISVVDHGIGIPEAGKGRIFDKFFRAENAVKVQTDGTGLGLYFARAIVIDHGGKMWFDSVEGQGTTFSLKLPIY
jgi:PAS domain S-box-containing protein